MDKRRTSLKKNIGYQTIYHILITCLPLITAPYLARVLGATQQGIYSFANSIAKYFTLVAMLGISNHGTRSIAEAGDDRDRRSKVFSEIYSLQFLSSSITLFLYILYILMICRENKEIALILSLDILACVFNISWLFFGMEQFKVTVTRNTIVRLTVVSLILLLVKKEEDLWIYALLMAGSTFIGSMVFWLIKGKLVDSIGFSFRSCKDHLKPVLALFIPLLAMSVYHIMDSTMLGILSDYDNCGYYYNADKVINIPLGIITGISTVLFPRMVAIIKQGDENQYQKVFSKSVEAMIWVSAAMSFGIAAIAKEFTPFFFGPGFDPCVSLIMLMAPVMMIKAVSTTIRYQYLVPKRQEMILTKSVFIGAIANLIANIMLIPSHGALGATWGTLIAEGTACIFQIVSIRKEVSVLPALTQSIPYLIISGAMFFCVRVIAGILTVSLVRKTMIEILMGVLIFSALCFVYSQMRRQENIINDMIKSFVNR